MFEFCQRVHFLIYFNGNAFSITDSKYRYVYIIGVLAMLVKVNYNSIII